MLGARQWDDAGDPQLIGKVTNGGTDAGVGIYVTQQQLLLHQVTVEQTESDILGLLEVSVWLTHFCLTSQNTPRLPDTAPSTVLPGAAPLLTLVSQPQRQYPEPAHTRITCMPPGKCRFGVPPLSVL